MRALPRSAPARWARTRVAAGSSALALVLAACGSGSDGGSASRPAEDPRAEASEGGSASEPGTAPARGPSRPLRAGEWRATVTMSEPYAPSAPNGVGTDDYRCLLLDPDLAEDTFLTGTDVLPGNPEVVHHVILFLVPPDQVDLAEGRDEETPGPGWTCFGSSGVPGGERLDDAPWLAAWAPGGREQVFGRGYGIPVPAGSRVVMQVHYNLLAGTQEDVSATRLRLAPAGSGLTPVRTVLLPAPVELPCRPAYDDGPLCKRQDAMADVRARFGDGPGATGDFLHLLCGSRVNPGPAQSCSLSFDEPMTVRGAAGHMHLLGRSIRIEANPGTPRARTLLDIGVWDFDNQAAVPVDPFRLRAGDTVRVTCRHSQRLRDLLPAFEGQPDRYVVWGDGTTDEMCLGLLQVTGAASTHVG